MLQGIITAGIGTTVTVLATNQAYPICLQIAQNPAIQFIWRHINIRRAHAEEAQAQQAPAPVAPPAAAPVEQAQDQHQAPVAPAEQHHCEIM